MSVDRMTFRERFRQGRNVPAPSAAGFHSSQPEMTNLRLANLILLSRRRVNNRLQVYGIDRLRIADASIMPDITSGNTMAPCVVIGERAAEMIKADYGI
jgi:hypothetical protein